MTVQLVPPTFRKQFDSLAPHPLQSWAWGEFREQLGQQVVRLGEFRRNILMHPVQCSFHQIPKTPWTIGYCPRGLLPTAQILAAIKQEAEKHRCIFVKFEPNVQVTSKKLQVTSYLRELGFSPGKPLFTPYSFQIDLTQSEEELLSKMKPKTRYNVRLAQKKGVIVEENNSKEALEVFQQLTEETTRRQHFFAHDRRYRELLWEVMRKANIAHLIIARYKQEILTAWVLFFYNGVGYYPYGASSNQQRELMTSSLVAWRSLLLAKQRGCHTFDYWGSLGPHPDRTDPWYGFHRFKEGYGGKLVEFVGSWDLVIRPLLYHSFQLADRLRWLWLKRAR